MTGSDDSSNTRPISVAELLARNGTIGAPPVGGRRRRRRGNADAVTVAELTGEIPIIRPDEPKPAPVVEAPAPAPPAAPVETRPYDDEVAEAADEAEEIDETEVIDEPEVVDETQVVDETEVVDEPEEVDETEVIDEPEVVDETEVVDEPEVIDEPEVVDEPAVAEQDLAADPDTSDDAEYADAVAEYAAHIEKRDTDTDTVDFFGRPRRPGVGRFYRTDPAAVDAETMSPDPVEDDSDTAVGDTAVLDATDAPEVEDVDTEDALAEDDAAKAEDDTDDRDGDELPSYLRSTQDTLFGGGQTVADDMARRGRGTSTSTADADLEDDLDDEETIEPRRMSPLVHGLWIVGQSIIAVVFGAGLFVAFDQLWKWNNIVALVLSVLVILGLVVGVRVVRKTEDIGSTLIAVAVGALVTLGPLALLQSG